MGALDTIPVRSLIKVLQAHGFKKAGQRGSHMRFTKKGILRPVVVAVHDKEIKLYLAKQAALAMNMTPQELLKEIKKY